MTEPSGPVDGVRAHAVEERAGARAVHVELGERRLVDQHRALAGGDALGLDRRRPVLSGPAARPQVLVAPGDVHVEPVDALPAGLLAEAGAVPRVPRIRGRDAQRAPGEALLARVLDVVVRRVDLDRAREREALRAVLAAEAADVHVPEVPLRLALDDPLRHDLADAARAGEAVGAEARRHPEAGHLGLAQDELAVGRERLGAVEELLDLRRPPSRARGGSSPPSAPRSARSPRSGAAPRSQPGCRPARTERDCARSRPSRARPPRCASRRGCRDRAASAAARAAGRTAR